MLKSEKVYREMKRRILRGNYSRGFRLVLGELAEEFGMSNLPIREAIERLEQENLVVVRKHSGASVAGVDLSIIRDGIAVLAYLEGIASATSIGSMDELQLAHAAEINRKLRGMLEQFEPLEFAAMNEKFHEALCAHSPNKQLLALLEGQRDANEIVLESVYSWLSWPPEESVRQHEEILDLARSRAPQAEIEMAVRAHRLRVLDDLTALEQAGVPKFGGVVLRDPLKQPSYTVEGEIARL